MHSLYSPALVNPLQYETFLGISALDDILPFEVPTNLCRKTASVHKKTNKQTASCLVAVNVTECTICLGD